MELRGGTGQPWNKSGHDGVVVSAKGCSGRMTGMTGKRTPSRAAPPRQAAAGKRRFTLIGNRLCVDFANTVLGPDPCGALRSWADVVDFLEAAGSDEERSYLRTGTRGTRSSRQAFAVALALRAALRETLAALAARRPPSRRCIRLVNEVLAADHGRQQLERRGGRWILAHVPARRSALHALVPIARSMAELLAEGPRPPVHKCANPRCVLFFYDTSRTRRRRWCSMAVCGNRSKVASHFRRRAGSSPPPERRSLDG